MKRIPLLSEANMLEAEARIPELATQAGKAAYARAMAVRGVVVKADNGRLVEARADGTVRVIRDLPSPTNVRPGQVLLKRKKTADD